MVSKNVKDTYSCSENDRITPGNILHLTGLKLKLTGNHPDVGIYFINETTAERTKVPTVNIVMNQNNRLMVLIPGLQPGSYRLEHITQYAGSGITLTEPHTSSFIRILRVL